MITRFTAYRTNLSSRRSHNHFQANPDDEPQFEGVIWSDGTCTLRWLTACTSTSVWNSFEDMINIHGHPEYGTNIMFHDDPESKEARMWEERVQEYHQKIEAIG